MTRGVLSTTAILLSSFPLSSITRHTNPDALWIYFVPPVLKWAMEDSGEYVEDKRFISLIIFQTF